MTTVLVTGAAGYIGSYVLPAFRERYELRLVDNRDRDGLGHPVADLYVRDVSDLGRMDEYRDLFRGVDAVVHLAFMRPVGRSHHERCERRLGSGRGAEIKVVQTRPALRAPWLVCGSW